MDRWWVERLDEWVSTWIGGWINWWVNWLDLATDERMGEWIGKVKHIKCSANMKDELDK